jgi:hypothetical protein
MRTQLHYDVSKPLYLGLNDLILQADELLAKQSLLPFASLVLRHLAVASVSVTTPGLWIDDGPILWNLDETISAATLRIGRTTLYCTHCPGDFVMLACLVDIRDGVRPIVVTHGKGVVVAELYADKFGISDELDALDSVQFVSGRIHIASQFEAAPQRQLQLEMAGAYNKRVKDSEYQGELQVRVVGLHDRTRISPTTAGLPSRS